MKRMREAKAEVGDICELASEWASKMRPPCTDDRALSTLGYKFMSSRPSARKSRLGLQSGTNFHTIDIDSILKSDQLRGVEDEDEAEGDWISQLGAQYMTRKKLYEARGPLSDCSAYFSPREHELELNNELDDSWIADFGMHWMRRRCRTRRGRYKVTDDAWLCELGFQWMNRVHEREHSNQTWLSDLSSQYMTRRKRETDRGIDELEYSGYRGILQTTRDHTDTYESISTGETKRKLYYSDLESELSLKSTTNGNDPNFSAIELGPSGNHVVDAPLNFPKALQSEPTRKSQASYLQVADVNPSNHIEQEAKLKDDGDNAARSTLVVDLNPVEDSELGFEGKDEVDASDDFEVLESDPLGGLEPNLYVDLDDSSSDSSTLYVDLC